MNRLVLLAFLLSLAFSHTLAQRYVRPEEASNYLGMEVILAGKIRSVEAYDSLRSIRCRIETDSSAKGLLIVIPIGSVAKSDSLTSFIAVGKVIGVRGVVRYDRESYLEVDSILKVHTKITRVSVLLYPPPNAHIWGAGVTGVDIDDINKPFGHTIQTSDTIFGYKAMGKKAMVYLGAPYPNQKLTVILKGGANDYLSAQIKLQGHGDGSKYLNDKKFYVIGVVSLLKGKPEIVITDPNGFIVVP